MTNPIEDAVLPLKIDAISAAVTFAHDQIEKAKAALAAADWNADVVAPRPRLTGVSREDYQAAMRRRHFIESVTTYTKPTRNWGEPDIRKASPEAEARYMAIAAEDAAAQYDAFVAKLVGKVGPVASATLAGSHVWGYSFLTVTKADGSTENWKTQQIINQSKLGTIFNQWPTRKLK